MTAQQRKAFDRAWRSFNQASCYGEALTRPAFAELVTRAPELFAAYVVTAAHAYILTRPERARFARPHRSTA